MRSRQMHPTPPAPFPIGKGEQEGQTPQISPDAAILPYVTIFPVGRGVCLAASRCSQYAPMLTQFSPFPTGGGAHFSQNA